MVGTNKTRRNNLHGRGFIVALATLGSVAPVFSIHQAHAETGSVVTTQLQTSRAFGLNSLKKSTPKGRLPTLPLGARLPAPSKSAFNATRIDFSKGTLPKRKTGGKSALVDPSGPLFDIDVLKAAMPKAAPKAYGTSSHPYTTKRARVFGSTAPTYLYPYAPTGALYARFGSQWFSCSASMIAKGVIVTAAHCIFNYGQGNAGWLNEAFFAPGLDQFVAPFGYWVASNPVIPTVYFNGTDVCAVTGVVCENDIAVMQIDPKPGIGWAGWYTGIYGWLEGNFGYSNFLGNTMAQITQLGFPVSLDFGGSMQRTDSIGYQASPNNVIIGSDQTGGSSGGPWLVNFGMDPDRNGNPVPFDSAANVVAATTSWQNSNPAGDQLGASQFGWNTAFPTSGNSNIRSLLNVVCTISPSPC
jgi:hypothetical protein